MKSVGHRIRIAVLATLAPWVAFVAPGCAHGPVQPVIRAGAVTVEAALGKGARAVLVRAPFHPEEHELTWCAKHLCAIDGLAYFGTAVLGQVPTSEAVSLTVTIDGRSIALDTSGMFNPFSPVEDRDLYVWLSDNRDGTWTFRGEFGEGGGAYYGESIIHDDKSLRTILTCVECLSLAQDDFRKPPSQHEPTGNIEERE